MYILIETVQLWVEEGKIGSLSAKSARPLNAKCQTSGYYSLRATAISRQKKGLCHSYKSWPQTWHEAKVF